MSSIVGKSVVDTESTAYLVLHTESGNRCLPLVGSGSWTFGRGDDNDFVLCDRWVSRNHSMLQCKDGGQFYLIDLGSRNGSFVNGRRVNIPIVLKHSDHITFGETKLEFYYSQNQQHPKSTADNSADNNKDNQTATLHVRQQISVMVVDIRDFTVLARQLDEELLSDLVGSWFHQAGLILRQYGSWVDKYIGDAVMALWFHGEQELRREQVVQILQTISDIHKMTVDLGNHYTLPFPLRIGAGINTGYAMVGNYTGQGARPEYTAIGDTVNAAFRLESATKQLKLDVALGETTYNSLCEFVQVKHRFQKYFVDLKGYEQPNLTYAATFEDVDNFLLDKLVQEYSHKPQF